MRNYLDHKDEVRYVDGLLANSQEWNWFIELVESTYDFEDINDWSSFRGSNLNQIFSKCIKILEVEQCKELIQSNYSKLLFLTVWITKLENNQNTEQYYTDFRLFITHTSHTQK